MKTHGLPVLAGLLLSCLIAAPAAARVSPYVRLDYGGSQLRMSDANRLIHDNEGLLASAGFPASFHTIGTAYGPSGSAGLWLLPGLRVGATGSYVRAVRVNHLHVPGQLFWADDQDFRMTEFGAEAAVRFVRLAGLTIGANVAQGRAELVEGFSVEDLSGQYYQDGKSHRTKTTYGAFIGLDQTNGLGLVGYVRAGFQYRDMGHMPADLTVSDGTSSVQTTGKTVWLDYSGIYLKVGIGYDLVH